MKTTDIARGPEPHLERGGRQAVIPGPQGRSRVDPEPPRFAGIIPPKSAPVFVSSFDRYLYTSWGYVRSVTFRRAPSCRRTSPKNLGFDTSWSPAICCTRPPREPYSPHALHAPLPQLNTARNPDSLRSCH